MLSFKEFISKKRAIVYDSNKGDIHLPTGINIARSLLPQIKDNQRLLKFLKNNSISYKIKYNKVSELKPIQNEINLVKASSIPEDNSKFIVVSKDNYIIDGHHRYVNKELIEENLIKICQIELNLLDLLTLLKTNEKIFNSNRNMEISRENK